MQKKSPKTLLIVQFTLPLHSLKQKRPYLVRWMSGLVNGLQNRVHPFESGTHLQRTRKEDGSIGNAG